MKVQQFRRAAVLTVAAAIVPAVLAIPATATPVTATYACKASPPLMAPQYATQSATADFTAPATVAPRTPYDVVITSEPQTVPSEYGGYTLKEIRNITAKVPVPANSTFVTATISGDVPGGATTWSVSGGNVLIKVPGPIPAGATYAIPTVTATLKSGRSGSIDYRLGGTSYSDPGLTFTAVASVGFDVNVPVACYPDPNPVVTSTLIVR